MIDVLGLHHLGLTVSNLDASCSWSAIAGYGPPERLSISGPDGAVGNGLAEAALEIAFVSAPRLTLELVHFEPTDPEAVLESQSGFGSVPSWSLNVGDQDPDGRPVTVGGQPCELRVTSTDVKQTMRLLGAMGFERTGAQRLLGHGVRVDIVSGVGERVVPPNAPGRVHLCCQVTDMTAACAELASIGFGLVSTPRVQDDLAWVFVAHPEGPGVELLSIGPA